MMYISQADDSESPINKSGEFFNDLYHRFLLTPKIEMKCLCLQAMTIVYGRHYEDIGCFHDTKYIVGMLDRVRKNDLNLFNRTIIEIV
jgi:DnaJ family protein C protein 13